MLNANSFSVRGGGGGEGGAGGVGGAGGMGGVGSAPTCRAFFPALAFANHDCEPNAEADEEAAEASEATEAEAEAPNGAISAAAASAAAFVAPRFVYPLRARRALAAGEEVTISYVPRAWPLARRRGALEATFDFTCDCARCCREATEAAEDAS